MKKTDSFRSILGQDKRDPDQVIEMGGEDFMVRHVALLSAGYMPNRGDRRIGIILGDKDSHVGMIHYVSDEEAITIAESLFRLTLKERSDEGN